MGLGQESGREVVPEVIMDMHMDMHMHTQHFVGSATPVHGSHREDDPG